MGTAAGTQPAYRGPTCLLVSVSCSRSLAQPGSFARRPPIVTGCACGPRLAATLLCRDDVLAPPRPDRVGDAEQSADLDQGLVDHREARCFGPAHPLRNGPLVPARALPDKDRRRPLKSPDDPQCTVVQWVKWIVDPEV
ncbi:MAG: hypothetical protein ACI9WU_002564 [Myxococcota bacterium]|jgi:hypothetical protein